MLKQKWFVAVLAIALVSLLGVAAPSYAKDGGKAMGKYSTTGTMPMGLAKEGKTPRGLEKQGKTPTGWTKGKKAGWTK
ncbi:MAG: hypothetical protein PHS37_10365 [Candidatus Omnitrophica bacterium]|nr:hypothetical protein [Candidatus Omnitrophota bacterium]